MKSQHSFIFAILLMIGPIPRLGSPLRRNLPMIQEPAHRIESAKPHAIVETSNHTPLCVLRSECFQSPIRILGWSRPFFLHQCYSQRVQAHPCDLVHGREFLCAGKNISICYTVWRLLLGQTRPVILLLPCEPSGFNQGQRYHNTGSRVRRWLIWALIDGTVHRSISQQATVGGRNEGGADQFGSPRPSALIEAFPGSASWICGMGMEVVSSVRTTMVK